MEALINMADNNPNEFVRVVAHVLPRDFQVTVDQQNEKWVINASPPLTEIEWLKKHNLPVESDT